MPLENIEYKRKKLWVIFLPNLKVLSFKTFIFSNILISEAICRRNVIEIWSTVRVPVFGRYQFFGNSEHYGTAHANLLS